jgi:hypothetical protein
MSLKAFHVVFISASALLAFAFAAWCLGASAGPPEGWERVAAAMASTATGLGLCAYEAWFLRKLAPPTGRPGPSGRRPAR